MGFPVSSSLRASLSAFTRLFADRYAADNIRMNSILPGFIETWDVDDATRVKIPMARAGTVEEIGQTALFLLGAGGGYITGQNIAVDGGHHARAVGADGFSAIQLPPMLGCRGSRRQR